MEHTPITTFDQRLDDIDARLAQLSTQLAEDKSRIEAELSALHKQAAVLDRLLARSAECQLLRVASEVKELKPLVSE